MDAINHLAVTPLENIIDENIAQDIMDALNRGEDGRKMQLCLSNRPADKLKRCVNHESMCSVGRICSGKNEVLNYLTDQYGMLSVSVGDMVREMAKDKTLELTRQNLHRQIDEALYSNSHFVYKITEKMRIAFQTVFKTRHFCSKS